MCICIIHPFLGFQESLKVGPSSTEKQTQGLQTCRARVQLFNYSIIQLLSKVDAFS